MPPLSGWTLDVTGFVGTSPAFDHLMGFFASDFFIPVAICLIMLGVWVGHSNPVRRDQLQRAVMNASVAIGISTLVVRIINEHEFWPRPFLVDDVALRESAIHAAQTVFYMPHDPTFPSNAATVAFAAATGVWLASRKAGLAIYIMAFVWVMARFYAGIHFFVDIAVGAAIGVLTSYMISRYFMPRTEPLPTWALRAARFLYIA